MGFEFLLLLLILLIIFNVVYYIPVRLRDIEEKQAMHYKELNARLIKLENKIDKINDCKDN